MVEARGGSLDLEALRPKPVPDAENFASTPLVQELFSSSSPENCRLALASPDHSNVIGPPNWPGKSKGARRGGSYLCERPPLTHYVRNHDDLPDEEAARIIIEEIDRFATVLEEIAMAAKRRHARFPVQWEKGATAEDFHYSVLQSVAVMFRYRSLARLQIGDSQGALEDWLTMIRLAKRAADDPSLINRLVSMTLFAISDQTLWEALNDGVWNKPQLQQAFKELGDASILANMVEVLEFERAMICHSALDMEQAFDVLDIEKAYWAIRLIPVGWRYQNAAYVGSVFEHVLYPATGDYSFAEYENFERQVMDLEVEEFHPYRFMARVVFPVYPEILLRAFKGQAAINNAFVAIALEQHRQHHGSYPETLDGIDKAILSDVPKDVVTREPLLYQLRADGRPCIYSVGANKRDEGGLPRKERILGDWVWQYSLPAGFAYEHYDEPVVSD